MVLVSKKGRFFQPEARVKQYFPAVSMMAPDGQGGGTEVGVGVAAMVLAGVAAVDVATPVVAVGEPLAMVMVLLPQAASSRRIAAKRGNCGREKTGFCIS